jgi:hypothetical protein
MSAPVSTVTDRELYRCGDCRVWDPESQPSVLRELERDPHAYDDRRIVWVSTGQRLYGMQLGVELLLCKKHEVTA